MQFRDFRMLAMISKLNGSVVLNLNGLGAKSQILSSVAPPGKENSIAILC